MTDNVRKLQERTSTNELNKSGWIPTYGSKRSNLDISKDSNGSYRPFFKNKTFWSATSPLGLTRFSNNNHLSPHDGLFEL